MKSHYKILGDYIREVNVRNTELKDLDLLGISIQKEFIPSIANTIGTDMSKYKIVKKNQFAYGTVTSRNGDKISIALLQNYDEALISQAYISFEVIDENVLLPEYLMMWFRRTEFDRYARYMSYGSAREVFSWEEMCNVKLPVPTIEKQREIVKEFNTILSRINLKNNMINKLEETINTIYKKWFVNFDFPNEYGKPYKFSGGNTFFDSKLNKDIPVGWEVKELGDFITESKGGDWGKSEIIGNYNSKVFCVRGADIPKLKRGSIDDMPVRYILKKNLENKQLASNQIVIEISGGSPIQSTGRAILITKKLLKILKYPIICSNFCQTITVNNELYANLIFSHINYLYKLNIFFNYENSTIGLKNLDLAGILSSELVVKPSQDILEKYNLLYEKINDAIICYGREIDILEAHKQLILSNLMINKTIY